MKFKKQQFPRKLYEEIRYIDYIPKLAFYDIRILQQLTIPIGKAVDLAYSFDRYD